VHSSFQKLPPFIGNCRVKVAELDRDCTDHQESRCIDIFDQCQAKHFEEKQINEVLKNEEEQCFACNRTFAIEKSEPISTNPRTVEEFRLQIRREFVEGSAIDPELYSQVRIVADTEVLPGGDVETPIHDALNWKATRFGHQSRPTLFAALLLQESGECWQAKLSNPRKEAKGKTQKYETPVGNGSRTFLPEIPASIRRRIGTRYGVEVPLDVPFWNWVEQQTEVEIIFTEGAKKALSLLSQGYIAIALYGVNGGYSNVSEIRSLTADVQRFAKSKRPITLAFDQDAEAGTRSRVAVADCDSARTRYGSA
jgi:hypothetical protein